MKGKHYEDSGDLNAVLVGNQLLLVCSAAPHAWVVDLTVANQAAPKLKADAERAIKGGALDELAGTDPDAVVDFLSR